MKSGFVTLIGRPNVGKSTLFDALLKSRLSIITPKAETTREAIRGIFRDKDAEIVFIDTPGLFKGKSILDQTLLKAVRKSMDGVDVLVLLLDASDKEKIKEPLQIPSGIPLIVCLNKIDLIRLPEAMEEKRIIEKIYPDAPLIEMSVKENFGLEELLEQVKKILPEGPHYYDETTVTDKDETYFIKEIIREQLLLSLKEEVPHQLAVRIEALKKRKEAAYIKAKIIVSKEAHKGIIIGRGGTLIKKIGSKARPVIEKLLKRRVFLDLCVSLKKDWLNDPRQLKELGYL